MAWGWNPQCTQGHSFHRDVPFSLHKHTIKYFILLLQSTCFITELCVFISSSRNDITVAHLGISKRFFPHDREAASETARLSEAGWTNLKRQENDGADRKIKGEWNKRDWVSAPEPAIVSPEISMMIAPTFHCRAQTPWRLLERENLLLLSL